VARQTPRIPKGFAHAEAGQSMQMVNGGFPAPSRYGFEMVDGFRWGYFGAKTPLNRKFTSNQISAIFRKFSAA
jgi:hypothetical protein